MFVKDLSGPQLNHWAAKALGWEQRLWGAIPVWFDPNNEGRYRCHVSQWNPCENWAQGGAMIEREKISIEPNPYGLNAWAACYGPQDEEPIWIRENAETPLIAAMRAFVASKFGDEVPETLFKGPAPEVKKYPKAKLISPSGDVSPVCADTPKPIDRRKATWTIRWEAVTCKKCLERKPVPHE